MLEPAIFEERQNLQQLPSSPHERSHQRKLSDEDVAYVNISLPTTRNSTIYQPTRRSHGAHALVPSSLTDVVEDNVHFSAVRHSFYLSWNILRMVVHYPVGPQFPSFFELLVIPCGG